ncbi:phospholipid-binding protein [Tabrizicola thermarum]|uniref:phospholipid-binding protein n=1 Tax=Tabrizicola thermarum TaxID=2670345 RepID=UPI000FFB0AB8|nr:phospholipid-binding protein [Tabrizicola thermarum]
MPKFSLAAVVALALATPTFAFEISFTWDGLKSCTSGNPNTVANPRFMLKDVPEGTKFIRFKLVDKNVPDFNHGGGVVAYSGQTVIEPGAFKYKSPCPPSGAHTYEWTASAQSKKSGGKLGVAKAARKYPE